MAGHAYLPAGIDSSTCDTIVKCKGAADCNGLPVHRHLLGELSPQLEAEVTDVELKNDASASTLVGDLIGDSSSDSLEASQHTSLPVLYLQSTSEEGVRLLLGHAYGIEIGNRFCVKTASEVALIAKKYDIPDLLHKADAFLQKAMDDRTTDRLRCKPAFWASQKTGITDSAMRFLIFAEQAGLVLMQKAVENLLAHIVILDSTLNLQQHLLAGQVQRATWQNIVQRVSQLEVVASQKPTVAVSLSLTSPISLSSHTSYSSFSSSPSPSDSPRSTASSLKAPQVSNAYAAHLARSAEAERKAKNVPAVTMPAKQTQPRALLARGPAPLACSQGGNPQSPSMAVWPASPMTMQPRYVPQLQLPAWQLATCGYTQAYGYPPYCYPSYPVAGYTH